MAMRFCVLCTLLIGAGAAHFRGEFARHAQQPRALAFDDLKKLGISTDKLTSKRLWAPVAERNVTLFVSQRLKEHYSNSTYDVDMVEAVSKMWSYGGKARSGNYFDVGGNVGAIAFQMAAFLKQNGGKVYTVEAMPPIAQMLEAGVLNNTMANVFVYNYAVGPGGDANDVTMTMDEEHPTTASAVEGGVGAGTPSATETEKMKKIGKQVQYKVPATSIDAMAEAEPALQKLLAMKLDIEGFEGQALRGAKRFLSTTPPCILNIELYRLRLEHAGTPPAEVVKGLAEAGYDTQVLQPFPEKGEYNLYQKDMDKCMARVSP